MKMKKSLYFIIFLTLHSGICHAIPPAPDLFGTYQQEISSEADAKLINIYDAWSSNMENLIRSKVKKGIIVDGIADTDQYSSDGVGNIIIKEGAEVGPIINNTNTENSTIIINKTHEDSRH